MRKFRTRGNSEEEEMSLKAVCVVFFAICMLYGWLVSSGLFGNLWVVIWRNQAYPIVLVMMFGYGLFWKFRNHEKFTWGEWVLYCILTLFVSYPCAATSYYFFTDLQDREIWNGYVTKTVYEEAWTERVTTTGRKGRTTTTYVYHSPRWFIVTNHEEEVTITKAEYVRLAEKFGTEKFEAIVRLTRSSIGDGNRYVAEWNKKPEHKFPTAVEHHYVNYLKASDSVLRVKNATSGFEKLLQPYPRVHACEYGCAAVDRVVCAGVAPPEPWKQTVSRRLSLELMELGKKKEVNVLVYLAQTEDQAFFYALKEAWIQGKNNDVIVIIGMKDFPQISWVKVLSWTDNTLFCELLADTIRSMRTLQDGEALAQHIASHVAKEGNEGFKRKPMEDYEYLVAFIGMPWWGVVLLIIVLCVLNLPVIWFMCANGWNSES